MSAVVTGAASGLGLALVRELAQQGTTVVGLDLAGDHRATSVADAGGRFVACDVTSADDWHAVAAAVSDNLGRVDLLALNAGIMTRGPASAIDDDPLALVGSPGYRRVFAVNVDGVALGLATMRPLMADGSAIVVTASTAALEGLAFDPFYAASKHAVLGLVRSLGRAFADGGVRLNALCPGGMDTAIVPEPLRASVPAATFRPPGAVARAVLAVAARAESGAAWLLTDDDEMIRRYDAGVFR